jgi:hypothetical protein
LDFMGRSPLEGVELAGGLGVLEGSPGRRAGGLRRTPRLFDATPERGRAERWGETPGRRAGLPLPGLPLPGLPLPGRELVFFTRSPPSRSPPSRGRPVKKTRGDLGKRPGGELEGGELVKKTLQNQKRRYKIKKDATKSKKGSNFSPQGGALVFCEYGLRVEKKTRASPQGCWLPPRLGNLQGKVTNTPSSYEGKGNIDVFYCLDNAVYSKAKGGMSIIALITRSIGKEICL